MFKDEDLRAEIEAEFAELQETHFDAVVNGQLTVGGVGRGGIGNSPGFRVFHPNPPKSPERKAALRKYMQKHKLDLIREALLRGERPKQQKGKRGRPATRWAKVAAELGIDLNAPSAPPTPSAA